MNRVKLEVIKPWITTRISDLLGMEDDVLVEFVSNQLEADTVRKLKNNHDFNFTIASPSFICL